MYLYVCLSVRCLRPAKAAGQFNVLFIVEIHGGPRNIVLDGSPDLLAERRRSAGKFCTLCRERGGEIRCSQITLSACSHPQWLTAKLIEMMSSLDGIITDKCKDKGDPYSQAERRKHRG